MRKNNKGAAHVKTFLACSVLGAGLLMSGGASAAQHESCPRASYAGPCSGLAPYQHNRPLPDPGPREILRSPAPQAPRY